MPCWKARQSWAAEASVTFGGDVPSTPGTETTLLAGTSNSFQIKQRPGVEWLLAVQSGECCQGT